MPPRTIRRVDLVGAALVTWLSAGCAGRAAEPAEPAPRPDPCLLPTGQPGEPRALVVVVPRGEDTAAVARPQPEPLVRLDCTGTPRPAAAQGWVPDSSHRTWTLTLATSALDIGASSASAEWSTRPDAATTLRYARIASVVPLDELRLAVSFDRSSDSVPPVFADPSLAIVTDSGPAVGTTFSLRRLTGDPRDALDAGADVLLADDPELLAYARARSELVVQPLPWSRVYALVVPAGQRGFEDLIPGDSASLRAGLARDAVRVEARPAEGRYWWADPDACPEVEESPTRTVRGLWVAAQDWNDPVARAIAERLVALSSKPMRVTGGLDARSPIPAIHSEHGSAYIVPLPRTALVPCREVAAWPAVAAVVPLIETRRSVVVRRGVPPLTVEFDGRLRAADTP
ncbi:MAG TPA: hypothetical protein VH764_03200 [Gemmatimonadales bacterium]